jgi:hypothetical protein
VGRAVFQAAGRGFDSLRAHFLLCRRPPRASTASPPDPTVERSNRAHMRDTARRHEGGWRLSILSKFQLTSCVKPGLYVARREMPRRFRKGMGRCTRGQAWSETRCSGDAAGCAVRVVTTISPPWKQAIGLPCVRGSRGQANEAPRMSRTQDAPRATRPLAVQALPLPARPALACTRAVARMLVRERAGTLGARSARV